MFLSSIAFAGRAVAGRLINRSIRYHKNFVKMSSGNQCFNLALFHQPFIFSFFYYQLTLKAAQVGKLLNYTIV